MTGTGTAGLASDHDRPGNRSFKLGDETRTVPPRCPRTALKYQRSPPGATREHAGTTCFRLASNARESAGNASLGGPVACPIGKGAGRSGSDHLVDAEIKGW